MVIGRENNHHSKQNREADKKNEEALNEFFH
jgi:hypothetical protein